MNPLFQTFYVEVVGGFRASILEQNHAETTASDPTCENSVPGLRSGAGMLPRPLSPVTQTTVGRHWPCRGGNRQVLTKEVVQTCERAGGHAWLYIMG